MEISHQMWTLLFEELHRRFSTGLVGAHPHIRRQGADFMVSKDNSTHVVQHPAVLVSLHSISVDDEPVDGVNVISIRLLSFKDSQPTTYYHEYYAYMAIPTAANLFRIFQCLEDILGVTYPEERHITIARNGVGWVLYPMNTQYLSDEKVQESEWQGTYSLPDLTRMAQLVAFRHQQRYDALRQNYKPLSIIGVGDALLERYKQRWNDVPEDMLDSALVPTLRIINQHPDVATIFSCASHPPLERDGQAYRGYILFVARDQKAMLDLMVLVDMFVSCMLKSPKLFEGGRNLSELFQFEHRVGPNILSKESESRAVHFRPVLSWYAYDESERDIILKALEKAASAVEVTR